MIRIFTAYSEDTRLLKQLAEDIEELIAKKEKYHKINFNYIKGSYE